MHTIIETSVFLRDADRAGLSEDERSDIVALIAGKPEIGDLIPGTGGARKVRVAGRGKGKSGGYRIITYYAAKDVPILMLAVIDKGERADLSKAEQNELRKELIGVAEDYRASVRRTIARMKATRRDQQ